MELELYGNLFVSYMFLYIFKSIFLFQEADVSTGHIQCPKEYHTRLFLSISNMFTVVAQELLLLRTYKTPGLRAISWRMGIYQEIVPKCIFLSFCPDFKCMVQFIHARKAPYFGLNKIGIV